MFNETGGGILLPLLQASIHLMFLMMLNCLLDCFFFFLLKESKCKKEFGPSASAGYIKTVVVNLSNKEY